VPLLCCEPFPFSVRIAHSSGEADVGVRLCEAYHAVVHHPAVVVVLLFECGKASGLLPRLDVLGAVAVDLCSERDVAFFPHGVCE
jgi:hypothetical protein